MSKASETLAPGTAEKSAVLAEYKEELSEYGPVVFDAGGTVPTGFGYKILAYLGTDRFERLRLAGELVFLSPGSWAVVTRWVTVAEVIEKYGALTKLDLGPRGGFRSVTYGKTTFYDRRFLP